MKNEPLTLSEDLLVFSDIVNPLRDGSYRVDVNYVEGLDYLCAELYLEGYQNEEDMVVDSHWINPTKDSAGTTRLEIPLTICQPASTYIVKVYALKYGYPKYYFTTTNSIVVLKETNSGSILFGQLKNEYETFEELEATIYYPNDNELENLWMEIGYSSESDGYIKLDEVRKDINENSLYWQPLPNQGLAFGSPGTYTLSAIVYQKIDGDDIPVEVTRDSREITVTATRGKLVYDPQLPAYIPADNDADNPYTFYIPRLDGTDGADFYYIRVESLDDNGADGQHLIAKFDETDDCGPEGHKVTVQGVSDCVRVHIEAGGKGLAEYYWQEIYIPVMNVPTTSRVSIGTKNEWMPTAGVPATVPIHTDIPIYVDAPGAKWVKLYDAEGQYDERRGDTVNIVSGANVGNIGTNVFYATACFSDNGKETRESAYFTITGTSSGKAGPYLNPDNSENTNLKPYLTDTNVTRGNTTTVTYPKCKNANHYWLEMDRWNEADSMWDFVWDAQTGDLYDSNGGTAMVATIALDPGTYRVRACAEGIGYDRYEVVVTRELKITDREIPQNGILVTVNQETVDTMEEFAVSAYAPKAKRLEIYWDYENSKDYKSESWKNTATWTNEYDSSGTYQIVVRAWYTEYDEDGKPVIETSEDGKEEYEKEYSVDSTPMQVTVIASENNPDLSFTSDPVPATVTETKQPDTVELFTVAIPEHADGVYAVVQFEGDDQPIYNDGIDIADNKPLNVSFNAKLDAGRVLRVDLTAYGKGYNAAHISKRVTVVPAKPETYEAEILFIDHPNDSTIEIYPNEHIDLIVRSKDESKQIKAIRMFDGNWLRNDEGPNEEGKFESGTDMGEPGAYTLYAMVTFEALPENFDWDNDEDSRVWVPTNLLTVNVLPDAIGGFDFIDGSPNPVSVKRGEDVTFTFTAATDATKYSVDAWEDKPNGESYNIKTTSEGTTVTLNTLQLPEGEFIIRGRAGTDGMGSRQSESEVKLIVTENPEVEGQIYLEVEKTTATTYEEINASVCAPGAESVEIIRRDSDNIMDEREFAWGNDTDIATGVFSWSKTGTVEVFARAYYENDPEPKESACVPVTITASLCKIWLDTKGIPTSAKPGEALSLAMTKPNAAKYMDWGLYYDWDGDWSKKADQEGNGALNFEIPADKVIDGKTIMLSVNVGGIDYEENHQVYLIPVVSTSDKVTIAVSKNNVQTTTVQVEEKFTVTIHAPGAEYVQFYDGNKFRSRWIDGQGENNQFTVDENGDCVFTDENFNQAEDQTIYAIAKIDDEFYTSKPVRVSVTSQGTVGAFTTSTANKTITRGDDAVFTFTAAEHASKYWVDVYSENEQGGWNQQFNLDESTDELTCTLHTANLSPGRYRVLGQARGVGFEQKKSTNEIMITIVNPSKDTITVSKAEPMVNENITVSIFKAGASKLSFARDNEDPFDMGITGEYWTGDYINFYSAGIHTLNAYYWEEGQWIAFSTINVNVKSNGICPLDVSAIPTIATAGKDLQLTVPIENADSMHWEMFYNRNNDPDQEPDQKGDGAVDLSITGEHVIAGNIIELRVSARKNGYEDNFQSCRIKVYPMSRTKFCNHGQ